MKSREREAFLRDERDLATCGRIPSSPPRIFSIGRPEYLDFIEVSEVLKALKVRTFEGFELFCFLASFMIK